MSSATVRAGFDVWAQSAKPSLEHPREKTLRLRSGEEEVFMYLKNPAPRGATVTRATLTLRARGASSGSRTLSVHRVNESWKESRLNWNTRPAVTGSARTAPIAGLSDREAITVDVTPIVAAWAAGSPNYGFRITTSGTARHNLYGLLSAFKPTLLVEWSDKPSQPVNLKPSEAATSLSHPFVTFDYLDYGGNTSLAAVEVQIGTTSDFVGAWSSGWVSTTSSGLDLSRTDLATPYPGLAEGASVYWRVRARDGAGLDSAWSDPVTMSRTAKPTVTITNMVGGTATEPTPPVFWTSPGQVAYEVLVATLEDPENAFYTSGVRTGTATAFTIPEGVLADGVSYRITVRTWDGVVREATPGDDTYAYDEADCILVTDAAVGPVATLTAAQEDLTPWVVLTWTRSTTPDSFVLLRDGQILRTLDPSEVFVSGTTYSYVYYGARPNRSHVYSVRAVVNGVMSPDGPKPSLTTSPSGLWLVDFDRAVDVTLWGNDEGTWNMQDDAAVYTPVGSTEVVRIVNGMRGLEGSLSGLLMEGFGKTFVQMEKDLYEIKSRPTATVRIVAGDENFTALIGNVRISPKPETRQGRIVKGVSFDFWQVGDLPFTPKL